MEYLFGLKNREEYIQRLSSEIQDIIVIGGGITGAGILLDATSRGIKTCLIEMGDFGSGTSGSSTKLVHGGLRYLKQLEVGLVREVGLERAIVHENGPHVTKSEPMLLPIIKGGSIGTFGATFGMWLYDKLARVKKSEQRRILHKGSVLAMEPAITKDRIIAGAYYYEYRTDDARLTLEVIKKSTELGAPALNYCKAIAFLYTDKKISGVNVLDLLTNKTFEIKTNLIINATGPWVDKTDQLDATANKDKLLLSKGIHIVVDASKMPIGQAMYFDTPDARMIFAIPRDGKVYIGTTESVYPEDNLNPRITKTERDYLINAVNALFEGFHLTAADVESGWAGLRPLIKQKGKKPGEVSRKDEIFIHPSGLMSIAGGKLTGYRKMAERIVTIAAQKLSAINQKNYGPCRTDKIKLSGASFDDTFESFKKNEITKFNSNTLTQKEYERLLDTYGTNTKFLIENLTLDNPYRLPLSLFLKLEYAMKYEMAITPLDFLIRRTSLAYFDKNLALAHKEQIFNHMYLRLNWNNENKSKFEIELNAFFDYLSSLTKD